MISRALMAILRCPLHPNSGPLKINAVDTPASRPNGSLNCQRCGHVYPITDGIPDMFVANVDHESFLKAESAQWDRFSSTYDEIRISDPIYMACVEAAVEQLRPQPHDVVLDAACDRCLRWAPPFGVSGGWWHRVHSRHRSLGSRCAFTNDLRCAHFTHRGIAWHHHQFRTWSYARRPGGLLWRVGG